MRLSRRIHALAGSVIKGHTAADIGTDHGYVPMLLIRDGVSPRVIMSDISEGSLAKARETFTQCGLMDKVSEDDFRTGDGLDKLFHRLEETAWDGLPSSAQSGDAVVSERHAALLEQAANHLDAACECVQAESWELAGSSLRTAAELIGCITGETATPDILDEIFSRFCIGK